MFILDDIGCVKKMCFLVLLLALSTGAQAEQSPPLNGPGSQEVQPGLSAHHERQHYFPRWPERKTEHREIVPPPPPGPYMSTALTLTSPDTGKSPFTRERGTDRAPARHGSDVAMSMFSPDIPWPSTSDSPNRWEPEAGYHYVQPQANARDNTQDRARTYHAAPARYQNGYMRQAANRSLPVRQPGQVYSAGGMPQYGYRYDQWSVSDR